MEEKTNFFSNPEVINSLTIFKNKSMQSETTNDLESQIKYHTTEIVESMIQNPNLWDNHCPMTIKLISDDFISSILNNDQSIREIENIFSASIRFLVELYLSSSKDLNHKLTSAIEFSYKNINEFDKDTQSQIEFAFKKMPLSMCKSMLNKNKKIVESIEDFKKIPDSIIEKRKEWENDLEQRELRVNALRDALSKYESAFNFVGLFDGFNQLAKQKKLEKDKMLIWLIMLGALTLVPLFTEIWIIEDNILNLEKTKLHLALLAIPTISAIALLIYYFRVILHNYRSVNSQLLQIELRKTLCQFIQSYAEYSSKLKESNKTSLDKFESIIFSSIVSTDEKIPSTFDGLEQLASLIKSVKQ